MLITTSDYSMTNILVIALVLLFCIPAYLLPSIIAFVKNHSNKAVILLINLFAGYTILAWIVCFVWAVTGDAVFPRKRKPQRAPKPDPYSRPFPNNL